MRVGLGFDVHRFDRNRKLVLGGIEIPNAMGLLGHSDADVVLHAVIDAILGALAMGDIGTLFPNTDPRYKNADSKDMLQDVMRRVSKAGYRIGNVDVMVLAERPKLASHVTEMRKVMAGVMRCTLDQVSVKATTMERMGFVGREEGMAAEAVALLVSAADGDA